MALSIISSVGSPMSNEGIGGSGDATSTLSGFSALLTSQMSEFSKTLLDAAKESAGDAALIMQQILEDQSQSAIPLTAPIGVSPLLEKGVQDALDLTLSMKAAAEKMKGGAPLDLSLASKQGKIGDAAELFSIANPKAATELESALLKPAADTANITDKAPTLPFLTSGAVAIQGASRTVETPLGAPNWGGDFNQQVVWMAKNGLQTAQINVHPQEMGPIQITLHMNGDKASLVFTSAFSDVRQHIQDALPQLKDMLQSAGISLGQSSVGSHSQQASQQQQSASFAFSSGEGNANESILSTQAIGQSQMTLHATHRGMVDLFA